MLNIPQREDLEIPNNEIWLHPVQLWASRDPAVLERACVFGQCSSVGPLWDLTFEQKSPLIYKA